jgi:hypothetical protein
MENGHAEKEKKQTDQKNAQQQWKALNFGWVFREKINENKTFFFENRNLKRK